MPIRTAAIGCALALGLGCLAGCPNRTAVWIRPNSTAAHLEFVFGRETGHQARIRFYSLRIQGCGSPSPTDTTTFWMIGEPATGKPSYPSSVEYGVVPAGFEEMVSSAPLRPGCYMARTGGSGSVRFVVAADGGIEFDRPDASLTSVER